MSFNFSFNVQNSSIIPAIYSMENSDLSQQPADLRMSHVWRTLSNHLILSDSINNELQLFSEFKLLCQNTFSNQEYLENWIQLGQQLLRLFSQNYAITNLAKLICIIDHYPKLTINIKNTVSEIKLKRFFYRVQILFHRLLRKTQRNLSSLSSAHQRTSLYNHEMAQQMDLTRALAKLLIPKTGLLNKHLIPAIIHEFVNNESPQFLHIKNILNLFQSSKNLRNTLHSIVAPEVKSQGELLIRCCLALPFNARVTAIEARRAAFSALLYHYRQQLNRTNCFASFIAIELLSMNPTQCLLDFSEILQNGRLLRKIDGKYRDFPFLVTWCQEQAYKIIPIDAKGRLDKASYLWESPAFLQLCAALGLPNAKKSLEYWLQNKIHLKGREFSLAAFCKEFSEEKTLEASLIFTSAVRHPVLEAWENAIAGMAEVHKDSLLTQALPEATYFLFKKSHQFKELSHVMSLSKIQKLLKKAIFKRARYLYDSSYTCESQSPLQGAFILYDRTKRKKTVHWKRIDSSSAFETFSFSILQDIFAAVERHFDCSPHIKSNRIDKLLQKYHRLNAGSTFFKPWIVVNMGNNPKAVLKTYFNNSSWKSIKINPKNAKSLLIDIANLLISLPLDLKSKIFNEPSMLTPIRISGLHVFSIILTHPSLKPCYLPNFNPSHWIQKHVIHPAQIISSYPISKSMKELLIAYVMKDFIDEKNHEYFKTQLKNNHTDTIQTFRMSVRTVLSYYSTRHFLNTVMRSFDRKIINLLPNLLRKIWEKSLVHFGDSNWQIKNHNLHYAIGVNVGSGELELISVLDNGTVHEFLNQKHYFMQPDRGWEVWFPSNLTHT